MRLVIAAILAPLALAGLSATARSEPVTVSLCDVARHPERFRDQAVRFTAVLADQGYNYWIVDMACLDDRLIFGGEYDPSNASNLQPLYDAMAKLRPHLLANGWPDKRDDQMAVRIDVTGFVDQTVSDHGRAFQVEHVHDFEVFRGHDWWTPEFDVEKSE